MKYFLESDSNQSVLKTDKHFTYIKDFSIPIFIMPDVCANLSNYCLLSGKFAEMHFLAQKYDDQKWFFFFWVFLFSQKWNNK